MLQLLLLAGDDLENNLAMEDPVDDDEGVGDVGSLLHNLRSPPADFLCLGSLYCIVLCLQFLGGDITQSSCRSITRDSFSLCILNMLNFMLL